MNLWKNADIQAIALTNSIFLASNGILLSTYSQRNPDFVKRRAIADMRGFPERLL